MPDFLPVSLQNILHSRKSDLRKQKIISGKKENKEEAAGFFSRCLMLVTKIESEVLLWYTCIETMVIISFLM